MSHLDEDFGELHLEPVEQEPPEPCPKCGHDVLYGFGLSGGGYGGYRFCDNDSCDYFDKTQSES